MDNIDLGLVCARRRKPPNLVTYAVAAVVRFCWKHSRQNTGLPCVGLKGTVVSLPHCEQAVRVSTFGYAPGVEMPSALARFPLHALQRLGSFLNCLSWKNSCSPAVKTKSDPQSTHFKILSWNSILLPSTPCPCVLEDQLRPLSWPEGHVFQNTQGKGSFPVTTRGLQNLEAIYKAQPTSSMTADCGMNPAKPADRNDRGKIRRGRRGENGNSGPDFHSA